MIRNDKVYVGADKRPHLDSRDDEVINRAIAVQSRFFRVGEHVLDLHNLSAVTCEFADRQPQPGRREPRRCDLRSA